ncbi:MAG: DUF3899 domain-containing protein [Clostridia bacterium]|nr:DUF3899 domain-containing protein [Clostridia bacterium]
MKNQNERLITIIKISIGCVVAALCVIGILLLKDYWHLSILSEKYRALADAFTVPGAVFLCFGLLIFVSNEGAFTGVVYTISWFFHMFLTFSSKKMESYHDYIERRREKGGVKGYGFILVIGLLLMAAAIVFILLFHKVNPSA